MNNPAVRHHIGLGDTSDAVHRWGKVETVRSSNAETLRFYGRRRELDHLCALISQARGGRGDSLVICGDSGVGKTALLHQACSSVDARILCKTGMEFQARLSYGALRSLCEPLWHRLPQLPEPQREALHIVFGLKEGKAPDRFRVALAALTLLSDAAAERPLVCVADDVQWWDRESVQALSFIARRVEADRIAVFFALREPNDVRELLGLPRLTLTGLHEADARALLSEHIHAPMDPGVLDRLLSEARGNPLALLELRRSISHDRLAGGFGLVHTAQLPSSLEDNYSGRIQKLPDASRLLLLLASTEAVGDLGLLWKAADALGISTEAACPAESGGLIEFGTHARFTHPLIRSAVHESASPEDRRRAHQALAEVIDPLVDPDRRAWHLAHAASEPDEYVARELERSAERARDRAGVAAAAAFLEQSAKLSPNPVNRGLRALAAAQAAFEAGSFDSAHSCLDLAESCRLDERQATQAALLRYRVAFSQRQSDDVPLLSVELADRVEGTEPDLALACRLYALAAGMLLGRESRGMRAALAAAESIVKGMSPTSTIEQVIAGLVTLYSQGHGAASPYLKRALADTGATVWSHHPSIMPLLAVELWNDDTYLKVLAKRVDAARRDGSLVTLSISLAMLAAAAIHTGDLNSATSMLAEEEALAAVTGAATLPYARLYLAAIRGHGTESMGIINDAYERASRNGDGHAAATAEWAAAVLHNGLADSPRALEKARSAVARGEAAITGLALVELVEAGVSCGELSEAKEALEALRERTQASGTRWARGMEAYAMALVCSDTQAEGHYQEAIRRLRGSQAKTYLARAHLLYGRWLSLSGRSLEAQSELEVAHQMLVSMGAEAFARSAALELRTLGAYVEEPATSPLEQLTARELHIARLVATGATSKEIAARLFLSTRTVEAHLRGVFRKLGIKSRKQLLGRQDLM